MRFRRFLLVDAFCATVVVSAFFGLSYLFGESIAKWIHQSEIAVTVLVAVGLVVVLAIYLFKRRWMAKLEETTTAVEATAASDVGGDRAA
jgi:membrane protein DedA with SNARE-associated domain